MPNLPSRLVHNEWKEIKEHFIVKENECWEWTGYKDNKGYSIDLAKFRETPYSNRSMSRRIVQIMKGTLTTGLEIDHLCENTSCINPFHLEEVTHGQNMKRIYHRMEKQKPMRFDK